MLGPIVAGQGFPWATLTANVLGSLGLGLVFVLGEGRELFGADVRLLLGTGVMGVAPALEAMIGSDVCAMASSKGQSESEQLAILITSKPSSTM